MSRIGKLPIKIPSGIQVQVSSKNVVSVKGPLGEIAQTIDPDIKVAVEGSEIKLERPTEQKRHKALHGLYRSLISNHIQGVSKGHEHQLELIGVGYRAAHRGQLLDLTLGFSHSIVFKLPSEIKLETVTAKGKNPVIILKSFDKQLLGQVAAKIRSLRKPEPYKGKGIKYVDEQIRRKAGKSAAKQ